MARVALVGSGGFLGSHVAAALRTAGHDVVAVSHELGSGLGAAIRSSGADVAVNAAGLLHGTDDDLETANVRLVSRLVEGLAGSPVRLVQLGSSAEYGPAEPPTPISEDRGCHPASAYGLTKLAATLAVQEAASAGRVDGVVLRVFNPVGAGMSPRSLPGRAAALIRRAALEGGSVALGPLDATRDFVDARDVADAVVAACLAPRSVSGRVVNVGSGRGTTARELAALVASAAGYLGEIREEAPGSPRSEAVPWQVADIRAAAALLGWSPRRSLAEAVAALWAGTS